MDIGPVKIYSSVVSPRLNYIAALILGDILGLSWLITSDKRRLGKHPVLNYSDEKIHGSFRISPQPLLFEKGITRKSIEVSDWKGLPVFFPVNSESDFPFDIFAASFFLVTRYEEYLDHVPDEYGRYCSSSSLAFRNGFLDRPVIDLWANALARALMKKYPSLVFRRNEYKSLLTIDTDQPFAYLGKNLLRSIGGIFRENKSDDKSYADRYRILKKEDRDPFDVFDYMIEHIEKNCLEARFFFPVGDRTKYDHNPSWRNLDYRQLINKIARRFPVGLHPSFTAGADGGLINTEYKRLKEILGKEVLISRFHYLRLFLPGSYKNISMAGINEDYSMGYPDEPGFRAGIARPFFFYDLKEELQTNIRVVPFQLMDSTLYDYKKLDPESARPVIEKLIAETRKVGGLFVSIWHNTSLVENENVIKWREVFEFTLSSQKP